MIANDGARIRKPRLTRLVLDGLAAALTHSETMMACDADGPVFDKRDFQAQEAADKWLRGMMRHRRATEAARGTPGESAK